MPSARYVLTRLAILALVVAVALGVRRHVAVARSVPSASMLPTLWPGDLLLVARRAVPARGDVIVVRTRDGEERVKRVIGLPGDRVALAGGVPVVDGKRLPRYRVADLILPTGPNLRCPVPRDGRDCRLRRWRETLPSGRAWDVIDLGARPGDVMASRTVPAGRLFLLGDNRDDSADSRTAPPAGLGMVRADAVVGRATTILWSADGSGRWSRFWDYGRSLRPARLLKGVERTPAAALGASR